MTDRAFIRSLLWGLVLLLGTPAVVYAGGIEIGDQGARAMGRGGALVVRADDLSAIYYNPAGLARLRGTRFFYTHRLVYGESTYKRARTLDWSGATHGVPSLLKFDEVKNQEPLFPLGMMAGISSDFGLDDFTFAGGVYAPPALGTLRFPEDGPQQDMLIEQEAIVLFYNLSAAWKYKNLFGLGISLVYVDVPVLNFEMVVDGNVSPKMVAPADSLFDINTRIEGSDRVGFTSIIGAWYKPLKSLEFAIAGRIIPIRIDSQSKLKLRPLYLDLDEPITITKNGVPNNNVTFSFTMPVKLRGGIRYIHRKGDREWFDLELALHYDLWSMMDKYTMDAGITTEVMGQVLNIDKVIIKKNFRNTLSVRLGSDINVVPGWFTLRAGFFYETPAVQKPYAYLDAFSFHRYGPSAGMTLSIYAVDLTLGYTYLHQNPLVVTEDESKTFQQVPGSPCRPPYTDTAMCSDYYLGKPGAPINAGTYQAHYHLFNASLSINL